MTKIMFLVTNATYFYPIISNRKISNTVIMKNFKLILNLMLIATSFMFFQCTSDYTPIPGKDGENGIDGEDGIDGKDTSAAACIECHSNSNLDPINASYALSLHGIESLHTDRGTGDDEGIGDRGGGSRLYQLRLTGAGGNFHGFLVSFTDHGEGHVALPELDARAGGLE